MDLSLFVISKQDLQLFLHLYFKRMGNQVSDKRQKKVFNIIKNVPGLSQIYRIPRAIVYKAKGDNREFYNCAKFNIANINPLKCIGGIARGIVTFPLKESQGIWIGKRQLSNNPLGMTISKGNDIYHWCVMINGILYQASGKTQQNLCQYKITSCPKQKKSFQFFATDLKTSFAQQKIAQVVNKFRAQRIQYKILRSKYKKYQNCQTFVEDLLLEICQNSQNIKKELYICAESIAF